MSAEDSHRPDGVAGELTNVTSGWEKMAQPHPQDRLVTGILGLGRLSLHEQTRMAYGVAPSARIEGYEHVPLLYTVALERRINPSSPLGTEVNNLIDLLALAKGENADDEGGILPAGTKDLVVAMRTDEGFPQKAMELLETSNGEPSYLRQTLANIGIERAIVAFLFKQSPHTQFLMNTYQRNFTRKWRGMPAAEVRLAIEMTDNLPRLLTPEAFAAIDEFYGIRRS